MAELTEDRHGAPRLCCGCGGAPLSALERCQSEQSSDGSSLLVRKRSREDSQGVRESHIKYFPSQHSDGITHGEPPCGHKVGTHVYKPWSFILGSFVSSLISPPHPYFPSSFRLTPAYPFPTSGLLSPQHFLSAHIPTLTHSVSLHNLQH